MSGEFSDQSIDHHVEAIRVFVQPLIDAQQDRIHLQEFFNRVSESQPDLFDSLVQQPGRFQIKKQVVIRGKGKADVTTFSLTPQGPELGFPHKLPFTDDELPWPRDLTERIITCLQTLQGVHPSWKFVQVTKRRQVVFATGEVDSSNILRQRFAGGVPERAVDVGVGWADDDERYIHRITLNAKRRKSVVLQEVGGVQYQREEPTKEYGVEVVLEVANRRTAQPLDADALKIIFDHADTYYRTNVLSTLRGGGDANAP